MCGIAGIVGPGASDVARLTEMGDALAHRGPDDAGVWVDERRRVGLSHRRLSIVDLSDAGHQPMVSASGRYVLCYNGEIYNHAELRAELDAVGASVAWRGHSDSEVLVEAVERFGLGGTLNRAAGMFALALVDLKDRTLTLARDRFGEKPLYWGRAGRDIVFASELKALRRHPEFDPAIDPNAVASLVARGYIRWPHSIYAAAQKLRPGHLLTLSIDGEAGEAGPRPWYDYEAVVAEGLENPFGDASEARTAVGAALRQAVAGQSVADVPIGVFLSGGIDSSLVAATYHDLHPGKVQSFTVGFDDPAYDESGAARATAAHLGLDHHDIRVGIAEVRDLIPSLADLYDEPFADSSQIPTHLVARLARRHVKVALSGDGGDEMFAGYTRHHRIGALWRRIGGWPTPLRRALGAAGAALPLGAIDAMLSLRGRAPGHLASRFAKLMQMVRDQPTLDTMANAFLDDWGGQGWPLRTAPRPDWPALPLAGALPERRLMAADAIAYLPGDILCKTDRATMGASLEGRMPFLDHRLAAVAARVPLRALVDGRGGKAILRDLLADHLPRALFERPKSGFAMPVGDWLRGPLRDWAEAGLSPARLDEVGLDPVMVQARWQRHLAGREDASQAIWSILMLQDCRARWR